MVDCYVLCYSKNGKCCQKAFYDPSKLVRYLMKFHGGIYDWLIYPRFYANGAKVEIWVNDLPKPCIVMCPFGWCDVLEYYIHEAWQNEKK